jgi:hypothetical protein
MQFLCLNISAYLHVLWTLCFHRICTKQSSINNQQISQITKVQQNKDFLLTKNTSIEKKLMEIVIWMGEKSKR